MRKVEYRNNMKIVIVGHVDHGKSTLIGRLLFDTGSLSEDKMQAFEEAANSPDSEAELAHLLDQLQEERLNNMTIDTTQVFLKTKKRPYTIIDAPGHKEFLNNMITGASQAETGLLIVDVHEGLREQTKRHAYILSLLGIDKIIVVINKMDLADYEQKKFDEIAGELKRYLTEAGMTAVNMIPISAKLGENIGSPAETMKWYAGPCVIDALDAIPEADPALDRPLRFPVQNIYDIDGKKIVVGRVESGNLEQGQKISISPSGETATIKSIEVFGSEKDSAAKGESIGLTFDNAPSIERGNIIHDKHSHLTLTKKFCANIIGLSDAPITIDQTFFVRCATQKQQCRLETIFRRIDSSSLEVIEENAKKILPTEVAVVAIAVDSPIVIENFSYIEELGRITLETGNEICAAGIIVVEGE